MKKSFLISLVLIGCLKLFSQNDSRNLTGLLEQVSSQKRPELQSLSAEEIKKLALVNDGHMVFNKTTGCLNYFFHDMWYEVCGKCIPQFERPVISAIHSFASGNEVLLKDTGQYLAWLLPDSIRMITTDTKLFIKKPVNYAESKKYVLQITHLNDPCDRKPVLDTAIRFVAGDKKSKYSFPTVAAGTHFWLAEPVIINVKDEKVCLKFNDAYYYNWAALNKDFAKPSGTVAAYSGNICPAGFRIPSEKDAEELIEYNQRESLTSQFKLPKLGYVVPKNEKKGEPTDDRFFFMLKESNQAEGFQTLVISGKEIRIATLPRDVYVQVLCVSE
jgi:uncharacterized protein (TIGR02145 family)